MHVKRATSTCFHLDEKSDMADKILPEQLKIYLSNPQMNDDVVVIDCRSFLAYNSGHISTAHNVHCPPIVKRRSGGVLPLQNILRCQHTRNLLEDGLTCKLVVYDENTRELEQLADDTILSMVLKGLSLNLSRCEILHLHGKTYVRTKHGPTIACRTVQQPL